MMSTRSRRSESETASYWSAANCRHPLRQWTRPIFSPLLSLKAQAFTRAASKIHANIMHNLLTGQWVREIPAAVKLITCFGYFLLFSLIFTAVSPLRGLIALGVSGVGLTALCYWLFRALDFWVPPVMFVFGTASIYTGNVVLQYLAEAHQKRWLRGAFNRYVSAAVVESIVNDPSSLELGGQEIQATIFFSDLANFTSFSERLPPKELVAFLNEYFTPMTNIILEHRGALDKFIGDAIMAFWGAPLPLENHARYACDAALKMQETIAGLRAGWRERGLPLLEARMGIHSGPVVVGNVGSRERFNYTVLGDTVNLASRLEGANKFYGTTILISEDTFRLAGPAFLARRLDLIRVKGRQTPVKIYELIGKGGEKDLPFLDTFAEGLAEYKNRLWDRAELLFGSISSMTRHRKRTWNGVAITKTIHPRRTGTECLRNKLNRVCAKPRMTGLYTTLNDVFDTLRSTSRSAEGDRSMSLSSALGVSGRPSALWLSCGDS